MSGRARIAACFGTGRPALVTYFTAGDGGADQTVEYLVAAAEAGADLIELGVPFSDPSADGPVIEAAMVRALATGMRPDTLGKTLAIARAARARTAVPIVLFGYYNPILQYEPERLAIDAAAAGIDGVLVVDLPPEHDDRLGPALTAAGLASIRLLAPTTPPERAATIAAAGAGFLYYVSIAGVTGAASLQPAVVAARLAALRPHLAGLPVCAGFGVSRAEQVAQLAPHVEGVVVGSAIVKLLDEAHRTAPGEARARLAAYVGELKAACKGA